MKVCETLGQGLGQAKGSCGLHCWAGILQQIHQLAEADALDLTNFAQCGGCLPRAETASSSYVSMQYLCVYTILHISYIYIHDTYIHNLFYVYIFI